MSEPNTDPYADHEEMANHWWWRPGWKVGTRFYAWHITLEGHDEMHDLIDQYQEALKPFRTLDPIPREWRHITLQGLGHVEEVSDAQRDDAIEAVRARLSQLDPIEATFDRAVIFREAIALKPNDPTVFANLRDEIRAGIADAWRFTPEQADGFRAHISVAYSNAPASSAPIREALDYVSGEVSVRVKGISLIRMHRDNRMYEWETVAEIPLGDQRQKVKKPEQTEDTRREKARSSTTERAPFRAPKQFDRIGQDLAVNLLRTNSAFDRIGQDLAVNLLRTNSAFDRIGQDLAVNLLRTDSAFDRIGQDLAVNLLRTNSAFGRIGKDLAGDIVRRITAIDALVPDFGRFLPDWLGSFHALHRRLNYPPNWFDLTELPSPDQLDELLLVEGLPLAWVPDTATLEKLLNAKDAPARRRLIGRNWPQITDQCRELLDDIHHPELIKYIRFGKAAVRCLQGGEHEAAQALTTNLIDSVIKDWLGHTRATDQSMPFERDAWPPRLAIPLAAIWCAYVKAYRTRPVPRSYSRHATAHRVSGLQYNRLNAVIALMHLVGLLHGLQTEGADLP